MNIVGTLTLYVPDLFNQVQKLTNLSHRGLCDDLRPIMNAPGHFTIDEQEMLAPQLVKFTEKATKYARVIEEKYSNGTAWREIEHEGECEVDGNPDEGMNW